MKYGKYSDILYVESILYCDWAILFDCYKQGEWFKTVTLPEDWTDDPSEPLTAEEAELVSGLSELFVKEVKQVDGPDTPPDIFYGDLPAMSV